MRAALLLAAACVTADDYREPAVGLTGAAGVEACRSDRYKPCGWVYWFGSAELEFCIVWPDRIGPYPYKLLETAESLYGNAEISTDRRFSGAPVCHYQCPPMAGCNATGSCFCLEGQ